LCPLPLVLSLGTTEKSQFRILERCFPLKSLHPICFLVPIRRIKIARLICVWGRFIPNYHVTAKGDGALGGAYPAAPREDQLQRSARWSLPGMDCSRGCSRAFLRGVLVPTIFCPFLLRCSYGTGFIHVGQGAVDECGYFLCLRVSPVL